MPSDGMERLDVSFNASCADWPVILSSTSMARDT